jgi:hypothetical protein
MKHIELKKPDGMWVWISPAGLDLAYDYPGPPWADVPLRLKTPTGWAEQAYWGTPNDLFVKDETNTQQYVTKFWPPEKLAPHVAVWVTAEDMDVRDGDRVWEMYSQIPDGPPLVDGFLDIVGDELTPGEAYTDDIPESSNFTLPASGKQTRLRHDATGRPVALLRSHWDSSNPLSIPYEERLFGEMFAPYWAEPDTYYNRKSDLVHGVTAYLVFRMLGTGVFVEVSSYASPDSVGDFYTYMHRAREVYQAGYRYDGEYIWSDAYITGPTEFPGQQPLMDTLYVLETTVHADHSLTMRLNGAPLSFSHYDYEVEPSNKTDYPQIGDMYDMLYIHHQCVSKPDGTAVRGDLGWYLYEYKVWSGELTGAALAAERAYFATKYGVPT